MENDDEKLYQLVFKINQAFYDYVYKDTWLKNIFSVIDQEIITRQQTDFMVGALGGPKRYSGRTPKDAHPHIYIDQEMWDQREMHLKQAFKDVDAPEEIRKKWIAIDEAFKAVIMKKDLSECKKRYLTDTIIYFPRKKVA